MTRMIVEDGLADVIIPHVGETTTRVRIARWLKSEGEYVRKGETLLEIETDKATLEIEAYADGVLERILVPEGSEADALQVVAVLREEGAPAGSAAEVEVARAAAPPTGGKPGTETARAASPGRGLREKAGRVQVAPKARVLARELGVDLAAIRGTGPGGLITSDDVRAAARVATRERPAGELLSRLRRTIAERMLESKRTIPHFYLMVDVDMTEADLVRRRCAEQEGWSHPPTYTDLVVLACARTLSEMPQVNRSYSDGQAVARKSVDVGIAVSVRDGLVVPVLGNADRMSLQEISEAIRRMSERARLGKLLEADFGGKSMVVSNLGMYHVDAFLAIIDPPDPMILAVGRVAERVVPVDGAPGVRRMCWLTLSVDHRILDGALGSEYLVGVKRKLESVSTWVGSDL